MSHARVKHEYDPQIKKVGKYTCDRVYVHCLPNDTRSFLSVVEFEIRVACLSIHDILDRSITDQAVWRWIFQTAGSEKCDQQERNGSEKSGAWSRQLWSWVITMPIWQRIGMRARQIRKWLQSYQKEIDTGQPSIWGTLLRPMGIRSKHAFKILYINSILRTVVQRLEPARTPTYHQSITVWTIMAEWKFSELPSLYSHGTAKKKTVRRDILVSHSGLVLEMIVDNDFPCTQRV